MEKVVLIGGDLDIETNSEFISAAEAFHKQRKQKGAENLNYLPVSCLGATARILSNFFQVEISDQVVGKEKLIAHEHSDPKD